MHVFIFFPTRPLLPPSSLFPPCSCWASSMPSSQPKPWTPQNCLRSAPTSTSRPPLAQTTPFLSSRSSRKTVVMFLGGPFCLHTKTYVALDSPKHPYGVQGARRRHQRISGPWQCSRGVRAGVGGRGRHEGDAAGEYVQVWGGRGRHEGDAAGVYAQVWGEVKGRGTSDRALLPPCTSLHSATAHSIHLPVPPPVSSATVSAYWMPSL